MGITARVMAMNLRQLSSELLTMGVIEDGAVPAIESAVAKLSSQKNSAKWGYDIEKSNPIKFKPIDHGRLGRIHILLTLQLAYSCADRDGRAGGFEKLNVTFECRHFSSKLLGRWHIDLANIDGVSQEGPLFHLQFGGHSAGGDRGDEFKLEVPRWGHPPMDLVLACELVVANFFPSSWKENRDSAAWYHLVRDSEALCLQHYYERIWNHLSVSGKKTTLLHKSWVASS